MEIESERTPPFFDLVRSGLRCLYAVEELLTLLVRRDRSCVRSFKCFGAEWGLPIGRYEMVYAVRMTDRCVNSDSVVEVCRSRSVASESRKQCRPQQRVGAELLCTEPQKVRTIFSFPSPFLTNSLPAPSTIHPVPPLPFHPSPQSPRSTWPLSCWSSQS